MNKLKYFRSILTIAIPSYLAWGWIGEHFIPGSYESISIRFRAAGWGIGILVGSYLFNFFKKNIENFTYLWGASLFFYYMFMCSHDNGRILLYWHMTGLAAIGPIVTIAIVSRWQLYIWSVLLCVLCAGEAIHAFNDYMFFTYWLNMLTMVSISGYFSFQRILAIERAEAVSLEINKKNTEVNALYEMAAQAAHDIRSPVTALQMVYRKLDEAAPERGLIQGSINRINSIAEDMLAANKRKCEISTLNQSVSFESLMRQLNTEFSLRFPDLNVETFVEPGLSTSFNIKPQDIARILTNLVNNAFEAKATTVKISATVDESIIRVVVSDNGHGIPLEKQARLFSRGFTFGKETGNGLGLFGARQILASAGGTIELTSHPGSGTRVEFTFSAI